MFKVFLLIGTTRFMVNFLKGCSLKSNPFYFQ